MRIQVGFSKLETIREGEGMLEILIVVLLVLVPADVARGVISGKFDFAFTKRTVRFAARLSERLIVALGKRLSRI